ncbi:MAG TPA: porphobilinogen synthase [Candidatus Krumholzibacteria bacterium]|nr:porphobilinogen synthase [Candidatus Krumholzibacteria bacterium]
MTNDVLIAKLTQEKTRTLPRRERRLRTTPALRRMVRETQVTADDFVYPLFVAHGRDIRKPIGSMPGVFQLSVDQAVVEAERVASLGIPAVLLFGIPAHKDPVGEENFADDGIVQQAARAIKHAVPELVVVTDVCMCEYTDHGHCGILNTGGNERLHPSTPEGFLLNDETLSILDRVAISHAEAGADIVAPSGMIDGMVASIRAALDGADFTNVPIMSYSVKYASSFYGPFRDAAEGAPKFGDRKTHQMDPGNVREAVREAEQDIAEGADFLMVKPALAYLDVIRVLRDRFASHPLVAYNVSGEYSMIKAAAANGWMDEQKAVMETLTSIKRAGADIIISYHAKDVAEWLR